MKKLKNLVILFLNFFKVGLFTFGGGYAMISVMSHELVEKKNYVTKEEFSDVVAIAESTPGPIAINSATYIGYKNGGVLGSIFATLGVVMPSFIIIFLISLFFNKVLEIEIIQKAFKGIQCAVAVLIVGAGVKLLGSIKKNFLSYLLVVLSTLALLAIDIFSVNLSTIWFVLVGAVVGIAVYFRPKKAEKTEDEKTSKIADNKPIAPQIEKFDGENEQKNRNFSSNEGGRE